VPSDSYQYIKNEKSLLACSELPGCGGSDQFDEGPNQQFDKNYEKFKYFLEDDSIAVKEIKCDIKERIVEIARECGTEHQVKVFNLYLDGYTQMQIAKKLNICQASVAKSLNGNTEKVYGGLLKKLKKMIDKDAKYLELKKKLDEII
jgi:translation initiation factor 2 alpha subunit (eIF-2alpha)